MKKYITILISLSLCMSLFASITGGLRKISDDAVSRDKLLGEKMKMLEVQAYDTAMKNQQGKYSQLNKEINAVKKERENLHGETLKKLNSVLGGGRAVTITQKGRMDLFDVKSSVVKKSVWNPNQYPHINIEISVILKRKLKHKDRKFFVSFFDSDSNMVTQVPFYLSVGMFISRTKGGMEVVFYGNPKIDVLGESVFGVIE